MHKIQWTMAAYSPQRVRRIVLLILAVSICGTFSSAGGISKEVKASSQQADNAATASPESPGLATIELISPHSDSASSFAVGTPGQAVDARAVDIAARLRNSLATLRQATPTTRTATSLPIEQQAALIALRERLGTVVEMHMRPQTGTPRQIKGQALERAVRGVSHAREADIETARAFLRANRTLLRLDDPDHEFALHRTDGDNLGRRHLRFSQTYGGLPVWPAELIIHLDPVGDVDVVNGAFIPTPRQVHTTPVVDADAAIAYARAVVPGAESSKVNPPSLIIYAPGDRTPSLAWRLELSVSIASQWLVVIDALNGATLTAFNQVMDANVSGAGVDLFGVTRPLNVWEEGGTFFMVDTSKPMFDPTSDPPALNTTRGAIIIRDARNQPPTSDPQQIMIPALFDIMSGSATSGWLPDEVSAGFNFSATYDYYLERHSRNSFDNAGSSIIGIVRLGQSFRNAFWNPGLEVMAFGDGLPYAAALDIVAHELTHGITSKTANLIYQNQSGALNEAFSDIFGEAVEARTNGAPDWVNGAQLGQPGRSLMNPSSIEICCGRTYPSKMSEFIQLNDPLLDLFHNRDQGGVHLNSSIINHAFYLLAEGLSGAIGIRDAEQIFFRALSVHLLQNSQFIDARLACIQSAEEIFGAGSVQALKTAEAFDAVEILDAPSTPEPPPFPGTAGPDATLFVFFDPSQEAYFLGRREEARGDSNTGVFLSANPIAPARPSVVGDGSFAAFVNAFNDLCFIATDGSAPEQCLGFPGQVHSVAMSPSGTQFGFVLLDAAGQPDNSIVVIDRLNGTTRTFPLQAPAPDATTTNTILFADTMDFTADDQLLVYDALNALQLSDGSQLEVWSIYAIDLATETTLTLVPPIRGIDIGFPALSQTSDNFITFDAFNQATSQSTVFAGNLNTGDVSPIGTVNGFGVPGYTGDDTAMVYSQADPAVPTTFSLVRQPLAADRITPTAPPTLWLHNADFGVIYRRGPFTGPGSRAQLGGLP